MVLIIPVIIVIISAAGMIYPILIDTQFNNRITRERYYMFWLMIAAIGVRVICAGLFTGHSYDTSCFRAWASRLAGGGFAKFYSSDGFNNYPPGYMYVLRILGMISSAAKIENEGYNFLLKVPAMIVDLVCGLSLFRLAMSRSSFKTSFICAALWLFNPAVIINSSLWGQVDVIYTAFIGLMLYFITEKKLIPAYFAFALSILLKPQTFVLTPILVFAIIEQVFLQGFDKKVFFKNLAGGLSAIALMLLLCVPFGLPFVFKQYAETLHGNIYFTQNAFNMWGFLGRNYSRITQTGSVAGYILMAVSVALTAFVYFRSKNNGKVCFCAGMLMLCFYMMSVKVNERYAFTSVLCFIMAFILNSEKSSLISFLLITLSQFFNMAWVLFIFETDNHKYFFDPWIRLYSGINILLFIYIIYVALAVYAIWPFTTLPLSDADKEK